MEKREQLTRTCSACGLQKPLSAFLQITSQGTIYGYICSTCRSAGIKEKPKNLQDDEHSSSTTGARIGAKQRVQMEKEQKREFKEIKDKRVEETKKREEITEEKTERFEQAEKVEKNRRENYLEGKKSFLNYQTKQTTTRDWQSPAATKAQVEKAQQTAETEKQEKSKEQQERISGGKFTDDNQALNITTNITFRNYQIAMGTNVGRQTLSQFKTSQSKTEPSSGKDPIKEFIDKTWEDVGPSKPSSRKR